MIRRLFYIVSFVSSLLQCCYASETGVPNVFVSILPQKYFIERIAGEHVTVSVMVGAGHNPAIYEPLPKQMASLNESQLYFRIGVPFEDIWIDVIEGLNSNLKIVHCCTELSSIFIEGHTHDDDHIEDGHKIDPHIWTSPINAKYIALRMKEELVDIFPTYKTDFESNYSRLAEDLDKLDQDIRASLASLKDRYIIVSHPSWGYYAKAYGLVQLPIELDGKEVRAKSLAKLIDFSSLKRIDKIFVQKQFNRNAAEVIAREIGADVIELDPLKEDYIANLYYVTDVFLNSEK